MRRMVLHRPVELAAVIGKVEIWPKRYMPGYDGRTHLTISGRTRALLNCGTASDYQSKASCPPCRGLSAGSLSVVSEARVSKLRTRARCVCALSIQRLEGRRWRLRRMRANGYGNSIFSPICKLLVLRYLENEHVRGPQFDALRWGMTRGA
jgi:hypothetical protein